MVDEVDENKNGAIDFNEFLTLVARKKDETEDELREAFDIVAETKDEEGNNAFISHADLKKMMDNIGMNLTDEDIAEMMAVADTNQDGMVNYEEFLDLLHFTH